MQDNITAVTDEELVALIKQHVLSAFYERRTERLSKITARALLAKKNAYLFAIHAPKNVRDLAQVLLSAFVSSGDETVLGNLLEKFAIAIAAKVYDGRKATEGVFTGIDLIFSRDSVKYVVSIKSGPDWGNASQITALKNDFVKAKELIRVEDSWHGDIVAVNGCIYGRPEDSLKTDTKIGSDYRKIVGQKFWLLISGDPTMHIRVLKALEIAIAQAPDLKYEEAYNAKIASLETELRELVGGSETSGIDFAAMLTIGDAYPVKQRGK